MEKKSPDLSVVATARNDSHGDKFLFRMQHFVSGFIEQCKRHDLNAELVLVEWNPPENAPSLSQVLKFPQDKGPCSVRIITVPKEVHQTLKHSDNLPLFQMIGKNVGIRRAFGKFVLATNIDILFPDDLILYLRNKLEEGYLYRVDRIDVKSNLPESNSFDEILSYCSKNIIRINHLFGTQDFVSRFKKIKLLVQKITLGKIVQKIIGYSLLQFCIDFRRIVIFTLMHLPFLGKNRLHTNACGDFTLLSANNWEAIRGYPEWNYYSWHLDSVLLYQAKQYGIKQVCLPRNQSIYHIEHNSGFTPEGAKALFRTLDAKGIVYLSDEDLKTIVKKLKKAKEDIFFNDENWGMKNLCFEEVLV